MLHRTVVTLIAAWSLSGGMTLWPEPAVCCPIAVVTDVIASPIMMSTMVVSRVPAVVASTMIMCAMIVPPFAGPTSTGSAFTSFPWRRRGRFAWRRRGWKPRTVSAGLEGGVEVIVSGKDVGSMLLDDS